MVNESNANFNTLYETNVYYFPFTKNLEEKNSLCLQWKLGAVPREKQH